MSNEPNDNDSEIENDIHQGNENEQEEGQEHEQNPAEYFKVTPDDYTDSDSNTIIDFDEEEESKAQNEPSDKNENDIDNKESENGEENASGDEKKEKKIENEEQGLGLIQENQKQKNPDSQEEDQQDNGEEQEEDQENHEENEEEENGVTDPNVKKLMKMDLGDKEGIIDLLMNDNLVKKSEVKIEKVIKNKNRAKFEHVESRVGKSEIGNKKSTFGRKGFQIEQEEGNPEFIKDIKIAASVVKDQLEKENNDVAKILFDEKIGKKVTKRITREQIDEKVKKTLERKKKNLEKIEAQMYEKQKNEETFTPVINHRKGENVERRNLHKFLKDQSNFSKRIEKRREEILNEKTEKTNQTNSGKPQVDKNSEELAKKINNTEQPAYLRLYNKRNLENEKREEREKLYKERKKEEAQKRKVKLMETNKQYAHIQSKIDMGQKKEEKVVDKFGNVEKVNKKENKEEKEREIMKQKMLQKKMKKRKGKLLEVKEIPTYKMLYKTFLKRYDEAIKTLNNDNENLTEEELHNLLYYIGMVSYPNKNLKEENDEENNENIDKEEEKVENPIQQDENKLINLCLSSLKNEQNQINKEDIKNFLICVVGLQKYYFYYTYKTSHEKEVEEEIKCKKEDLPEILIKKYNEELLTKVDKNNEKNNKYCYRTNDGKVYISLEKGHSIKKDFNMMALNYRNSKKPTRDINTLMQERRQFDFRPNINDDTKKYFEKYQDKIITIKNEAPEEKDDKDLDKNTTEREDKDPHMQYIEKILLQDKKRIYEIQKAKEELAKKEMVECTFKPKINPEYTGGKNNKNNKAKEGKNEETKKNRMVELYEKGTADQKKRKDRTKDEMEVEAQKIFCTFQPKKVTQKIPETKFTNDIYKEKEYKKLYQRLKVGRMERLVKESANDRYDLNKDLKNFVKQSKENKTLEYTEEEKSPDYLAESSQNNVIRNSKTSRKEKNESGHKVNTSNKNEEENNNNSLSSEEDGEKKEGIPLLIIDVNIRQGVKKKIYVYENDTPEGLAEKFAKEHNLEEETKNKLQNLIHSHMQRLLTRIEEENQSISEKSQTTPNNFK